MTPNKPIATLILTLAASPLFAAALPANNGLNWKLTPDEINSSCATNIKTAQDKIAALEQAEPKPTSFAADLGAVETINAELTDSLVVQVFLKDTALDKPVRDAANDCNEKATDFNTRLSADPLIYAYAKFAFDHAPDVPSKQLAKIYLEQGRLAGAALSPVKRQKVTELLDRLTKLQTDFNKNLAEDKAAIHINADEAKSLQPDFVKTFKADGDGYLVPVNESTAVPFEQTEASSDARRRFAIAYGRRGGDENVKLLAEAVKVRDQIAHLVGFKTWADYQLDSKVAKTPQRALALLNQVDVASLPKARAEVAELAKLKAADGDASAFQAWDDSYYEEKLKKSKYSVDNNEIRQYFPVDKVIPALLGIYEKLLSVKFEPIENPDVWAPGVLEYDIIDTASQKPIGWFYFDLYPRDGKYTHFATFGLLPGRVLPDGSYQKPIGAVVGNWPVASPGKPALLDHGEVTTFFHEFGHLMHGELTKAPYESISGTNVRHDFVEAPSQMLENWMWEPSILKEVSSNVTTGQPMPDDLIKRMIDLKHFDEGGKWASQAFYATYDMKLHSSGPNVDPTKLWFDLKPKLTAFPATPGTIPEASFGHIMSGYDAGYYGYLWSLVYAQDMFTKFKSGGLESPDVGMQYRKIILEEGGSEEPDALVAKFLGRPISVDAFDEYIGMKK